MLYFRVLVVWTVASSLPSDYCMLFVHRPLRTLRIAWHITFWHPFFSSFSLLTLSISHLVLCWSWHALCKWWYSGLIKNKACASIHSIIERQIWGQLEFYLEIYHRRCFHITLHWSPFFCLALFNIIHACVCVYFGHLFVCCVVLSIYPRIDILEFSFSLSLLAYCLLL